MRQGTVSVSAILIFHDRGLLRSQPRNLSILPRFSTLNAHLQKSNAMQMGGFLFWMLFAVAILPLASCDVLPGKAPILRKRNYPFFLNFCIFPARFSSREAASFSRSSSGRISRNQTRSPYLLLQNTHPRRFKISPS